MVEEDAERLEVLRLRRKAAQWRCATVHITDDVTARSLIILAANMDRKADDLEAGLAVRLSKQLPSTPPGSRRSSRDDAGYLLRWG